MFGYATVNKPQNQQWHNTVWNKIKPHMEDGQSHTTRELAGLAGTTISSTAVCMTWAVSCGFCSESFSRKKQVSVPVSHYTLK